MNAVRDQLGRDVRSCQHCAEHASLPMGKRAHGVEDVHCVSRALLDRGASLGVSRVRVPQPHDQPRRAGCLDQVERAGKLRRQSANPRGATRRVDIAPERWNRRRHDPLRGMHTPPREVDEGPFKMYAQNLRHGGCLWWALRLRRDVARNPLRGAADVFRAGRHGCGHQ